MRGQHVVVRLLAAAVFAVVTAALLPLWLLFWLLCAAIAWVCMI